MNKNLILFLIICSLTVGGIIVFAANNMSTQEVKNPLVGSKVKQNTGQPSTAPAAINFQQVDQASQGQQQNNSQEQSSQPSQPSQGETFTLPTGPITQLEIKDFVTGTGEAVKTGDSVEVNYNGVFLDGKKFDSSYDRGQTFSFTVGAGNVIKGWDLGVVGMKTGGKRILIIPSDLAYGETGSPGAIPPNTPLVFEIELVAIK